MTDETPTEWDYPTGPGPWYRDDVTGKLTHARDMPGVVPDPAPAEVEVTGLTGTLLTKVALEGTVTNDAADEVAIPGKPARKTKGDI